MLNILKIMVVMGLALCGCGVMIDNNEACHAAETQGYSRCRVTDRSVVFPAWNGCSESDSLAVEADATNPTGRQVQITICCGMLKNCTVRTR